MIIFYNSLKMHPQILFDFPYIIITYTKFLNGKYVNSLQILKWKDENKILLLRKFDLENKSEHPFLFQMPDEKAFIVYKVRRENKDLIKGRILDYKEQKLSKGMLISDTSYAFRSFPSGFFDTLLNYGIIVWQEASPPESSYKIVETLINENGRIYGEFQRFSPEFKNTDFYKPRIISLGENGNILFFCSFGENRKFELFYRKDDNEPINIFSSPTEINYDVIGKQWGFLVVHEEYIKDGLNSIIILKFDREGKLIKKEKIRTNFFKYTPSVSYFFDGKVVIFWVEKEKGKLILKTRILDQDGGKLAEFTFSDTTFDYHSPSIVVDSDGRLCAVWIKSKNFSSEEEILTMVKPWKKWIPAGIQEKIAERYSISMIRNISKNKIEIVYKMPHKGNVKFYIMDVQGRKVFWKGLHHERKGVYTFVWDGKDIHGKVCPMGNYFVIFDTGNWIERKVFKIIKLK